MFRIRHDVFIHFDEVSSHKLDEILTQGGLIMATVDDLVGVVQEVVAAVNTLEAKVTEALKGERISAETQAKLDQALADLRGAVADAADGVDEADAPPVA